MSILEGDPHTIQKALDEHARHVYVVLEPTPRTISSHAACS